MTNNVNTIVTTDKIRLSSWIVFSGGYIKMQSSTAKDTMKTKLYAKSVIDKTEETFGNSK